MTVPSLVPETACALRGTEGHCPPGRASCPGVARDDKAPSSSHTEIQPGPRRLNPRVSADGISPQASGVNPRGGWDPSCHVPCDRPAAGLLPFQGSVSSVRVLSDPKKRSLRPSPAQGTLSRGKQEPPMLRGGHSERGRGKPQSVPAVPGAAPASEGRRRLLAPSSFPPAYLENCLGTRMTGGWRHVGQAPALPPAYNCPPFRLKQA